VLILVWLLRRTFGGRPEDAPGVPGAPGDLVACAHCGVLVPRTEAREAGGAQYCNEEHARLGPRQP